MSQLMTNSQYSDQARDDQKVLYKSGKWILAAAFLLDAYIGLTMSS